MSVTPSESQEAAQNPYGAQQYSATVVFAPAPPRGLSITSMVLGIVGLVGFAAGGGLLSIGAVVFGHIGIRKEPTGRGMAIAGLVTGYVGIALTALLVIVIVLVPLIFLMLAAGVATGTSGLSS